MIDHERNEYIAGSILDAEDRAAWEQSRNEDLGYDPPPTRQSMIAAYAAERAAVEQEWAEATAREYERGRRMWVAELAVEREAGRDGEQAA